MFVIVMNAVHVNYSLMGSIYNLTLRCQLIGTQRHIDEEIQVKQGFTSFQTIWLDVKHQHKY